MEHGAGLVGREWLVSEIDGTATTGRRPSVQFLDDGRLVGSTGVNRIMGQYDSRWVDGSLLVTFGPAATTMMAGPPEAMAQEQLVLGLLHGEHSLEVVGDRLRLDPFDDPDGVSGQAALLLTSTVEPPV